VKQTGSKGPGSGPMHLYRTGPRVYKSGSEKWRTRQKRRQHQQVL